MGDQPVIERCAAGPAVSSGAGLGLPSLPRTGNFCTALPCHLPSVGVSRHPPSLVSLSLPSVNKHQSRLAARSSRALPSSFLFLGLKLTADSIRASQKMQQWQVGPVPDYVYANSTHQSNDMQ